MVAAEIEATQTSGGQEERGVLRPGSLVGRYEILAILGRGSFGVTYRARDAELGRDVAIKEYLPAGLAVREGGTVLPNSTKVTDDFIWGRDRFITEGKTLATLNRAPAIVRVFDFLQTNGTAYIVMELVHGETLEKTLSKRGPLSPDDAAKMLSPLLDGLQQVHDAGFLHRDIKPANILLDADGHPTLIDFGAARSAIAGHTSSMTAIFTPGYGAPEQFTSARQGPWTDIYGLSATLHHCLTGRTPPSAFDRLVGDTYEPLSHRAPSGLAAGIDAGLALKASDRPQSIAGWRALLAQGSAPPESAATVFMRHSAPPAAVATVSIRRAASPQRSQRRAIILAAAAVLLVGAAAAAYLALQMREQAARTATVPPRPTITADVPFVRGSQIPRLVEEYKSASGAKALALNFRGIYGVALQRANDEIARRDAMQLCDDAVRRGLANPRSEDICQLYAVGNEIASAFTPPPMPLAPYLPVARPAPAIPFDPSLLLFINETSRRTILEYGRRPAPKAVAIGRRSRVWATWEQESEADAIRRSLQACGYLSGRQCAVLAANDALVVRLPETHRILEAMTPEDIDVDGPRDRDALQRYLVADDWRALAGSTNRRFGVATSQPNESQAVSAALADCARAGGLHCTIRAIGPFLVTVATGEELRKMKEDQAEARRKDEAARLATGSQPFDGVWTVDQQCPESGASRAYSLRYEVEVKNGVIFGEHKPPDPRRDTFTYAGQVGPDGRMAMNVRGVAGMAAPTPGTIFEYAMQGTWEAGQGKGVRTGGRACSFVFTKR